MGLTPSPFDCWLAERGLLTFELRYDRAEANARRWPSAGGLPGVRRVLYPTRPIIPTTTAPRRFWARAAGTWSASRSTAGAPRPTG
jgi:cystathionine beta-lyase/cystathionine gamma-synthase